jgi:hypothetical protein
MKEGRTMRSIGSLVKVGGVLALAALAGCVAATPRVADTPESRLASFVGSWQGSAICVDMVAAPKCYDETLVADVRLSDTPGGAKLMFYGVKDGQRQEQYAVEFTFSEHEGCWTGVYPSPGWPARYCFRVEGRKLSGTELLLTRLVVVRTFDFKRQ